MKIRIPILLGLMLLMTLHSFAQNQDSEYPSGKAFAKIYTDFYAGMENGEYNTAFEVKRAYLGYASQLNEHFYAKVNLDIGSPNDESQYALLRRYAYFKNAYVEYTNGRLKMNFGIIPIYHFKLQEKTWGHRYIYKSANDKYGLGYTADLGASVQYMLTDNISTDFSLTNGEGYTSLQSDDKYKAGAGITGKFDTGLMFRIYGDVSRDDLLQTTFASFLAYKYNDKGTLGVEFNQRYNDDFSADHIRTIVSSYASWDFNEHLQLFGRYDRVTSNIVGDELIPYSLADDGTAIFGGIQYTPMKYVKIALNYQDWFPMAANTGNEQYIYLNFEIKL